jgi:glycosyltransferase involved in cell wall biosynthesis
MLAGMVVVTRSTGGLVDFFTHSMGRITESKDPEVFANMLIELIYNPGTFSEISAFNSNYAKRNFTVDPFIGRLEKIYTQV